jgi:mycothiol synthase
MEEVEEVANLLNACSLAQIGVEEFSAHEMRGEWGAAHFNLETDARVLLTPQGRIIGFSEFFRMGGRLELYVYVHPDYAGQNLETRLLRLGEERARQFSPEFPHTEQVVLSTGAWSSNAAAAQVFEQEGYRVVRHSWQMVIEFEEAPPAPQWPDGITVRTFVPEQDERIVYELRESAFADMWGFTSLSFEDWVYHLIKTEENFDPNLWFLAFDGPELVGHALCYPRTNEDPEMAWIQNLAVQRSWRQRGLGMALLQHTFGEFYRQGKPKAGLSVDSTSLTGAQRLYERAGMKIARQFDKYQKVLRDSAAL